MIKYMDKELRRARGALNTYTTLAFITNLKKLCNHPQLIFDKCQAKEAGFEGLINLNIFCFNFGYFFLLRTKSPQLLSATFYFRH